MLKKTLLFLSIVSVAISSLSANYSSSDIAINIPIIDLTLEEKRSLINIVEELKMAKDIYFCFYNRWNDDSFKSIAEAKERDIGYLNRAIFQKYRLSLPKTINKKGVFQSKELLSIYNSFIERGDVSKVDAFEVGLIIEDTINDDLQREIVNGAIDDLKDAYLKLLNSSNIYKSILNKKLGY